MSEPGESTPTQKLSFVTLKVAGVIGNSDTPYGIFNHREFCDQFIKSIIFCIDNFDFQLYGFVIVSDQIHMIVSAVKTNISDKIGKLKNISSREIIIQIGKKLNTMDHSQSKEQKELRRFFNQFINSDETLFWQNDENYLELKLKNRELKIEPITSIMLIGHLSDAKRNYMQLGANAFTKLMIETMKI